MRSNSIGESLNSNVKEAIATANTEIPRGKKVSIRCKSMYSENPSKISRRWSNLQLYRAPRGENTDVETTEQLKIAVFLDAAK